MKKLFIKFLNYLIFLILVVSCSGKDDVGGVTTQSESIIRTIKQFAIYYGWPSSLNSASNSWDLNLVAQDFAQYPEVVLGQGLQDPGHGDYANTQTIFNNIKDTTKVYGYITIGINGGSPFTEAQLQTAIDQWIALSDAVSGIFIDEAGNDYKLAGYTDEQYRQRIINIINYVHSKGAKYRVFLNAWVPDDLFAAIPANPLPLIAGDKFLLESFVISSSNPRETFVHLTNRVTQALNAVSRFPGLELYAINTRTDVNPLTNFDINELRWMLLASHAFKLDAIGWSEFSFSAGGNANAIMPYRPFEASYKTSREYNNTVLDTDNQLIQLELDSGSFNLYYDEAGTAPYFN